MDPLQPSFRKAFITIGLVWLVMFLIIATGYPNLADNERRIGAYVLDAVHNGHWFVQRDSTDDVASKPPMLTWMASVVTLIYGRVTGFAVHFPSALATLGTAWLILAAGWKRFGWLAAFLAALMFLLSPIADKQMFTARYDGLFGFPVTWAALAAFAAWVSGRGWTSFWLACAVATLVKGPLGILIGALGLFAAIWEWRSGNPLKLRGNHLLGIILFLVICGGWFGLAYLQMGKPLVDKMIGRELIRHSLSNDEGSLGGKFWEPTYSVLAYFLPWSFAGIMALWRVVKKPSADLDTRRFERFLFCWFVIGLILFSISPHQRGRLIFPLVPAFALLAGRELGRWFFAFGTQKIFRLVAATTVVVLGFLTLYHHRLLRDASQVKDTLALQSIANEVRARGGEQFPLTYVDAPFTIAFYLNTYRTCVSEEDAANLLRGDAAAFVAVRDAGDFQKKLGANPVRAYSLFAQGIKAGRTATILSNHPKLEWTPHMAAIIGPFWLQMDGVKLVQARADEFVFERGTTGESAVTFSNVTKAAQSVRVRYAGDAQAGWQHVLLPGEVWKP